MAENPNNNFKDNEENNIVIKEDEDSAAGFNKIGEPGIPNSDPDTLPPKTGVRINMGNFKWHWIAVFAVAVITIYLSLLNGVSLETALIRALYCTAIFWIIAEIVDWVIHKMR